MSRAGFVSGTQLAAVQDGFAEHGHVRFPYRFFAVTFLWSWTLCLPFVLSALGITHLGGQYLGQLMLPTFVLAGLGPAVGALYSLATFESKEAMRRYLLSFLSLRFGWKTWLLPILVLGGTNCAAWILPELWGGSRLDLHPPSFWAAPRLFLIMAFLAGGQEEFGWRGYILDPLEQHLGPLLGGLVLGVVWAVWHLPLFLIPGTGMDFTPYVAFVMLTTGYSWFFSWVRQASGKRALSGLYVHGMANSFGTVFPTIVMVAGAPQMRYWIWASLVFGVGLATTAIRSVKPR